MEDLEEIRRERDRADTVFVQPQAVSIEKSTAVVRHA